MADISILDPSSIAAPKDYKVKGAQEVILRSVTASFDGTGAASAWVPAVQIVDPSGFVTGTYPYSLQLAAGASADVSWFPGVGPPQPQSGSGVPPFPALDDYVFANANTTVTGIGFNSTANLLIQGNTVTLDGLTRVKVEFFAPCVELTASPPNNQAIGIELWDSFNGGAIVNKGTICFTPGNRKTDGTLLLDVGGPIYGAVILTPAAGTHRYALYAWKGVAGGTCVVFANTFVDGTGNFAPQWYRLTTT